ncbi:MAG: DUF2892 domain-containing protein [Marinilabiliaceae bacterium]|nr:DUF2892 domain-containing protein [Marinilabiliaceae bacterium]
MRKNIGPWDKAIRLIVGLCIGIAGYYYQSWWGLLGVIPILTAVINFCPLYAPFGITTCRRS